MSYQFPDNLNYADTHEYVLEENGFLKIGVSEFAVDQLGDIVFVELADQGSTLEKGDTFGTIESVKAVEEVYLPFSGEIVSVNESVIDNPELLQNDPIGEGWLIVIKPESKVSFDNLMTSEVYKSKVMPI
ncbi:glycine cleavage system protein GcvH [Prochlorococcus marinus]|uniref:glycine cleavage system protein GcvH n=1 Tax=Prochlorococcus marinus TaxID=1219 RepID=UPI001ADA5DAB|nr:glycine cleavage system protein GcvH [Prochlorococcus marinus]MBO8218148.1 glycine cleavage system protein GcvH [Prochlorococcus marinus XMU1405]MBW3039483.1 glycine cleavage system protein H [Prochlorococcus marinus str. MU1405]MBW3046939.1 glycine cleavage system protein H [Prochlorococcus marinus str. MU1406]